MKEAATRLTLVLSDMGALTMRQQTRPVLVLASAHLTAVLMTVKTAFSCPETHAALSTRRTPMRKVFCVALYHVNAQLALQAENFTTLSAVNGIQMSLSVVFPHVVHRRISLVTRGKRAGDFRQFLD